MRSRRASGEGHLGAEVVSSCFACLAAAARKARFDCHFVADFEGCDRVANFVDSPRGFVAHDEGLVDFSPNSAMSPEVNL